MNKCISPKGGSIALILSIRMNGADTLAGDHLPLRSLQSVKNIPTEPAGISYPRGELLFEITVRTSY